MRRHFLAAVIIVLLLPSALPAKATPGPDVCTGMGVMVTGQPLTYTLDGPAVQTLWTYGTSVGICVVSSTLSTAVGQITGWCDLATGMGISQWGHKFAFVVVGLRFVMTGEITGEASFFPNVIGGESCVTGSDNFLLWLKAAVAFDCDGDNPWGTENEPVFGLPLHYHGC